MAWTRSTPRRGTFVNSAAWPLIGASVGDAVDDALAAAFAALPSQRALLHIAACLGLLAGLVAVLPIEVTALVLIAAALACMIMAQMVTERAAAGHASQRPTPHLTATAVRTSVPSCHAPPRVMSDMLTVTDRVRDQAHTPQISLHDWTKLTNHMSHELRTPLNAVLGFSDLMRAEVFGPVGHPAYGDYIRAIHSSGRLLLKSADDALAITTLLTGHAGDGDGTPSTALGPALNEALTFLEGELQERNITLSSDIPEAIMVSASQPVVRQILINSLTEVASRRKFDETAAVTISASQSAPSVTLRITVSGRSMTRLSEQDNTADTSATPFALLLVRTLCDLAGCQLSHGHAGDWISIRFPAASQHDLFAPSI
jgi:signal transduction histidine kinase